MKNKTILSTLIATALCALTNVQAADTNSMSDASLGNPAIASGTGVVIKRGDLDDAMSGYKAQMQTLTPAQMLAVQKQILNQLINTKLLLAKATDDDKAAGKKAADLQITADIENVGSKETFDQLLKTNGLTEDILHARRADAATAEAVIERELKINVSDEDVQKFYEANRISKFESPEMARVSHILIFTVDPVTRAALPADQQQARRKLADSLLKAARSGADFGTLAKQYSEDPGSRAGGGELPPFPRGQMAPEIDAAVFSMTNSQVSSVITTSMGYQIVKLVQKIPAKKVTYLAAIADIKQALTRQKLAQLEPAYLDGLQKAAAVQILDPSLKAAGAAPSTP